MVRENYGSYRSSQSGCCPSHWSFLSFSPMAGFFQPGYYCRLGLYILCCEGLSSTLRKMFIQQNPWCLPNYMLIATPLNPKLWQPIVSRYCQMSPGSDRVPLFENHSLTVIYMTDYLVVEGSQIWTGTHYIHKCQKTKVYHSVLRGYKNSLFKSQNF